MLLFITIMMIPGMKMPIGMRLAKTYTQHLAVTPDRLQKLDITGLQKNRLQKPDITGDMKSLT